MNIMYDNGNQLIHSDDAERLYLLVEDTNEVYVDNFLLEQHQIDGLRFLFKVFNKKSPGIVVNFPPSCGKTATVALFLNAVTNVLKDPLLILCKDANEMQYWKEILLKWSSYVDEDIALESLNPFIKGKKVFLKTCENMTSYLRRHWSIVIIKENMDMFKLKFEVDFKIFITSTDIKKDLCLLSKIYTWLYQKPKVNILDFVAKENRPKERFRQSVQLDFLLEDFAIRRYINLKPFLTIKTADNVTENVTELETHDRKKRMKNKDATGTKIKRSKLVVTDDRVLNTTTDQDHVLTNDQIVKETLDQNFILINHPIGNQTDKSVISMNDQIVNEISGQSFMLVNDHNIINQTSDQNVFLINDDIINDQNVILINDEDDEMKNNDCDRNDARDSTIIFYDDRDMDYKNDIGHKSSIINENKNDIRGNDNASCKLDVESFIRDQEPVNKLTLDKPTRLYDKEVSKIKYEFPESNINEDSEANINKINDLGNKELLQKQLIKSLNLDDINEMNDLVETPVKEETELLNFKNHPGVDRTEIKDLNNIPITKQSTTSFNLNNSKVTGIKEFDSFPIKEESTESLNLEGNSKAALNKMKDLRKQLIESLGFDSDCKFGLSETKKLENESNSKVDLNGALDLGNKSLLQKQLIESLSFDSKNSSETSKVNLNEMRDSDINPIKEESTESLSLGSDSKVGLNEMKGLHNKNMLKKQLIESLGIEEDDDDVKVEIKEESINDLNDHYDDLQNVVNQCVPDLKDNEIIVIKLEPDGDTSAGKIENNDSNKRKSDERGKDLDYKISLMEERALKKFKGSLLDSIF